MGTAADNNDDAVMWHRRCEMKKVVAITGQQYASGFIGILENYFAG
jgi:hypothetical protein